MSTPKAAEGLQQDIFRKCPKYFCNVQTSAIDFDNLRSKPEPKNRD